MKKLVYLAGGITGLSYEEAGEWREYIKDVIEDCSDTYVCFNPLTHFNDSIFYKNKYGDYLNPLSMKIDLDKLRHSSVMILDLNHPESIGTAIEIGVAIENKIPIIAFCEQDKIQNLHPWLKESAWVIVPDYNEAMEIFISQYINED